jgi:hypothetical protein
MESHFLSKPAPPRTVFRRSPQQSTPCEACKRNARAVQNLIHALAARFPEIHGILLQELRKPLREPAPAGPASQPQTPHSSPGRPASTEAQPHQSEIFKNEPEKRAAS